MRILGNELDYNYNQKTIFDGGNEFRNFDIKSLKYKSEYVQQIEYTDEIHHIILRPEESRARKVYHFEHDINGQRIIQNSDGDKMRLKQIIVGFIFSSHINLSA